MLLFFDTETTGLPKRWNTPASVAPSNYPDIVSIAWILTDRMGTVISKAYHLVRPIDWVISPEVTAIHKISHAMAETYGLPLDDVMRRFMFDVERADMLVAHNIQFDQNVINNALRWRLNQTRMLEHTGKRLFCTMKNARMVVGLPGRFPGSIKMPKLSEMYTKLFGSEPVDLHNAEKDTEFMMKCFFEIWKPTDLPAVGPLQTNAIHPPIETTLVLRLS